MPISLFEQDHVSYQLSGKRDLPQYPLVQLCPIGPVVFSVPTPPPISERASMFCRGSSLLVPRTSVTYHPPVVGVDQCVVIIVAPLYAFFSKRLASVAFESRPRKSFSVCRRTNTAAPCMLSHDNNILVLHKSLPSVTIPTPDNVSAEVHQCRAYNSAAYTAFPVVTLPGLHRSAI